MNLTKLENTAVKRQCTQCSINIYLQALESFIVDDMQTFKSQSYHLKCFN